jgi:CBS domain-containing protein
MKAKDIMSANVLAVFPENSIEELAKLLTDNNISGAPVVDKDRRVIGIVTEKDIMYKDTEPRFPPAANILGAQIFLGSVKKYNTQLRKILATNVKDLMTKDVITVTEDTDIKEVVDIMLENNINRVPVTDHDKKLVGIISRTDIVRYMAKNM